MLKYLLALTIFACAACTPRAEAPPAAAANVETAALAVQAVRGAAIGANGYATIIDVPPAPFTPAAPGEPQPMTDQQRAGHEQFARAARFQQEVMSEAMALHRRLQRVEKGNYVNRYFDNEGEPKAVFQFLRNGPAPLRKYSKNPRFVGETVRFSQAELMAKLDFMMKTFANDRVIEGGGIGRSTVDVSIIVPEQEFRALVARKGVKIPEGVNLEFRATRSASEVNKPLPANIERLVRIFPRDDRPVGIVNSIDSRAKIELHDGCFRIADQGGAFALLPMGAQLFIDREGYLAFGSAESPGYARVGETVVFPGSIGEVTAPELVAPIHAACGSGKVIRITGLRSAAAESAQSAVSQNAQALRQFREWYGMSEVAARTALQRCIANAGTSFCPTSPPSPPMSRQADCPAGTKLSYGMCRTPEGYIRPVPNWLGDLVGS